MNEDEHDEAACEEMAGWSFREMGRLRREIRQLNAAAAAPSTMAALGNAVAVEFAGHLRADDLRQAWPDLYERLAQLTQADLDTRIRHAAQATGDPTG